MRHVSRCAEMRLADPTVRFHWEGPHAMNFLTVDLISVIAYDESINAASRWSNLMTAVEGQQYVLNVRFNCDAKYQQLGSQIFRNVEVSEIIVGYSPKLDSQLCDRGY